MPHLTSCVISLRLVDDIKSSLQLLALNYTVIRGHLHCVTRVHSTLCCNPPYCVIQ